MKPIKLRLTTRVGLAAVAAALVILLINGKAIDVGVEVDQRGVAGLIVVFLVIAALFFIVPALLRRGRPVKAATNQIEDSVRNWLMLRSFDPFPQGIHLFNLLKQHVGLPGRLPFNSSVQTLMISINTFTVEIPWRRLDQDVTKTEKDLLLNLLRCAKVGDYARIMLDCLLIRGDSQLLFFDYPSYRPKNELEMKTLAVWLVEQGINIKEFLDDPEFTIDRLDSPIEWKAAICRACSEINPASFVVRCDESMEFACTDRVHLFMAVCRALGLT